MSFVRKFKRGAFMKLFTLLFTLCHFGTVVFAFVNPIKNVTIVIQEKIIDVGECQAEWMLRDSVVKSGALAELSDKVGSRNAVLPIWKVVSQMGPSRSQNNADMSLLQNLENRTLSSSTVLEKKMIKGMGDRTSMQVCESLRLDLLNILGSLR